MPAQREIEVEATPEEVWEALATEEGRERWLEEDPAREIHVEHRRRAARAWSGGGGAATSPRRGSSSSSSRSPAGARVVVTETVPSFPLASARVGALRDVGPTADAAVEQHGHVAPDRVDDRWQRIERGDGTVDLAAAVIGDDHASIPCSLASRASSGCRIPLSTIGSDVSERRNARSSHVTTLLMTCAQRPTVACVLLGRAFEIRPEDRIGDELGDAGPLQEGQVPVRQVGRAPAQQHRVERHDEHLISGLLGTPTGPCDLYVF